MTRPLRVRAVGILTMVGILLAVWLVRPDDQAAPVVRLQQPVEQQSTGSEPSNDGPLPRTTEVPTAAARPPASALADLAPPGFTLRSQREDESGLSTLVFAHDNGSGLVVYTQQLDDAAIENTVVAAGSTTLPDGSRVAVMEHDTSRQAIVISPSGRMANVTVQTAVPVSMEEMDAGVAIPEADSLPMSTMEVEALAMRMANRS